MARTSLRLRLLILSALAAVCVGSGGCGEVDVGNAESVAALAGQDGGPGFFDGSPADPVRFDSPSGVAVIGTDRFVADTENHVIRKIDAAGNVTTFAGTFGLAGSTDATGPAARFNRPTGIAAVGAVLFVCDTGNHTIRRISAARVVTTLAGTPGAAGSTDNVAGPGGVLFSSPRGIASDGGNFLYVADTGNHKIRRLDLAGATSTFAGSGASGSADGLGAAALFSSPEGVAVIGTTLVYVSDTGNHTLRQAVVTGPFGEVTTLAGEAGSPGAEDGVGALARFRSPSGMTSDGLSLFVCDTGNHSVRRVEQSGAATTLAGAAGTPGAADGTGAAARFSGPAGIGTIGAGSSVFFVADRENHAVRRLTAAGVVTTVAGAPPRSGGQDGLGAAARFDGPAGVAAVGDDVLVADTNSHAVRRVTAAGAVATLAGLAGSPGTADGTGSAARFRFPGGVATLGNDLFVTDSGNHTVRRITPDNVVTTLAGSPGAPGSVDGAGGGARFNNPQGIVALNGNLYVVDTGNHTVRRVTAEGVVTTVAGAAGTPGSADSTTGADARFDSPLGIAAVGSNLFVADTGNHTVRRIGTASSSFPVDTFAGTAGQAGFVDAQGSSARFASPDGVGAVGSVLYVADRGNHAVRRISTARTVRTFAGRADAATTRNGAAPDALLNAPAGVAGVPGTIFFTDVNENVVRKILF
jgi:hypothetical protein